MTSKVKSTRYVPSASRSDRTCAGCLESCVIRENQPNSVTRRDRQERRHPSNRSPAIRAAWARDPAYTDTATVNAEDASNGPFDTDDGADVDTTATGSFSLMLTDRPGYPQAVRGRRAGIGGGEGEGVNHRPSLRATFVNTKFPCTCVPSFAECPNSME